MSDERTVQRKRHEGSRRNGETLTNGGGGVARGVKAVGHFAHLPAGVVCFLQKYLNVQNVAHHSNMDGNNA